MLLFTVVELINKLLGLYITGYLARVLPATSLGHYLSGLVMLGYAIELAFFGAQNRNNAEYAVHQGDYLASREFAARKTLTSIAALASAVFLVIALHATSAEFQVAPLLLVLACVPLTFDFVAYGAGRSQLIVIARFVSQVVAVGWITLVARGLIAPFNLYWGQLLQTASLTLLIAYGVVRLGRVQRDHFAIGITRFPSTRSDLAKAVVDQSLAFGLRLAAMAAVSSELLILNVAGDSHSSDLATSLRLVQVIFPFVVFYIDSRVRSVSEEGYTRYAAYVGLATLALLIGSPVLVRGLYGRAFMPMISVINAFAPAFILLALCQYQVIVALKAHTERRLIRRIAIALLLSAAALVVMIVTHRSLEEIAALYTIKAVAIALLIPTSEPKAKWLAAGAVIAAASLNLVFDLTGYYDAMSRVLH